MFIALVINTFLKKFILSVFQDMIDNNCIATNQIKRKSI